jgi:serine/arginine repetitive matrix protein 2
MFGFIPFASLFASLGQAKLNATPSLTRRFSLLQSSAGDTSLDGLKEGFAEQRSRGATNAITEEEEDLVLDALKKMRTDWSTGAASSDEDDVVGALHTLSGTRKSSGQSQFSTQSDVSSTTPSSPMNGDGSSRTSKREKRYTNNVFGSGQFRDRTYLRSVPRQNSSRSILSNDSRRGNSSANTSLYSNSPSVRPMTPEMHSATSAPSSPNDSNGSREELGTSTRSAPLAAPYPYATTPTSVAAYRLSKTFASSALPRVAASLDEVVSQLEEAGDDQVLVPRISQLHKPVALASSGSSSSGQTSGQVSDQSLFLFT